MLKTKQVFNLKQKKIIIFKGFPVRQIKPRKFDKWVKCTSFLRLTFQFDDYLFSFQSFKLILHFFILLKVS